MNWEVESLTALKTEKSSLVDSLTEQITTLSQEIADLQKALNEDTVREDRISSNDFLYYSDFPVYFRLLLI